VNRFQIFLRTKYVPSLVKIHWRMLILECSQGCYGRTDGRKEGRTVALLYPFINILQWILTKLGTYLVLRRVWNPIDFQGQRSRLQSLIFRRGDTPRFALPLLFLFFCGSEIRDGMLILECSQGCYMVKNLPSDLDLWPWKSIGFQTLLTTKYVPSLVKKSIEGDQKSEMASIIGQI
jgi:hypothetical protein